MPMDHLTGPPYQARSGSAERPRFCCDRERAAATGPTMAAMHRFLAVAVLAGCAGSTTGPVAPAPAAPPPGPPAPRGPYLGEVAGDVPKMFARGVVSRQYQELNAAFSPSGDELVFTLSDALRTHYTLVHMVRQPSGEWTPPQVMPFSGRFADADPVFSADGARLYFISKRPATAAETAPRKDFDIWYAERRGAGWAEPVRIAAPVNTEGDEFYISVTRGGALYFSRNDDIHRAEPSGDTYQVEKLGPAVNGEKTAEFDPFVAADESYLIFVSAGRPDSLGRADLYVSFRVDGAWQPARSLGPAINTKYFEYCPIMSPDGTHFFFTSYKRPDAPPPARPQTIEQLIAGLDQIENGLGNIYWMKADFLERMRAGGPPP